MSIYIKINSTLYKLPNRITLGRGAPFMQFDGDRSISRSHIMLSNTKSGVYVKDLASEAGTYIDGKRIITTEYVKWAPGKELKIGAFTINLLETANDEECVHIGALRTQASIGSHWSVIKSFFICGLIAGTFLVFTNAENNLSLLLKLGLILSATLIFALPISAIYLFITKFIKLIFKEIIITDIYLGEDGFMAHYADGSNMSFKLNEIKQWKKMSQGLELQLNDGKRYSFSNLLNKQRLIDYLNRRISNKEISGFVLAPKLYLFISFVTAAIIYSLKLQFNLELIMAVVFIIAAIVIFVSKKEMGRGNNKTVNNKKFAMLCACLGIYMIYLSYDNNKDIEFAIKNQESCTIDDQVSCKKIEYYTLWKIEKIDINKAKIACDVGNKSACYYSNQKRLPASSDKIKQ